MYMNGMPTRFTCNEILDRLRSMGDPKGVEGAARYGINAPNVWGVSAPKLRALAKEIRRNHDLAAELWQTGVHDARILATLVDDPAQVTVKQMERWVLDFNSWAVCDAACCCLFDKTPHAWDKAVEWIDREEEYVKRGGFVLMAALAVHDKKAPNERFEAFLPLIESHATDGRNFVKKAVNWALRQIGKRNRHLNKLAIQAGQRIRQIDSKAARWIAADALRELAGDKVQARLTRR
ncbi:MAG: DNA alkylation repair protein [Solirubrobacterales bacterium]